MYIFYDKNILFSIEKIKNIYNQFLEIQITFYMNLYYKYLDHTGDGHQRDTESRNLIPVFSATGESLRLRYET